MCFISFLHRGVPADIQIDIDEDRETERIYSLFTLSLLKLHKMEGKCIIKILLYNHDPSLPVPEVLLWHYLKVKRFSFSSVQFSSVAQSCPTLCNPMKCSMPGLPVHHQLPEFTQTHVHWVGDAIQPSHPLSSPSPPAPNPSQHQSLFQWVNSLHEVAKVVEFQL